MKIDIARYSDRYSVEMVRDNKLVILGEFDMYDKATRFARQYMEEKGRERGDEIWNWDGTYWRWTGREWRANHVSD